MKKPTHLNIEVGPRYGTLTKYEDIPIRWIHDRIGICYGDVVIWYPAREKYKVRPCDKPMDVLEIIVEILG